MIQLVRNFKYILFAVPAIFFLLPQTSNAAWQWTYYFRKATIEGYVFVDKRLNEVSKARVSCRMADRLGFFNGVLEDYKNKRPLENATVSLGTTGIISRTNPYGYFKMEGWWPRVKGHLITVSTKGICLTFNLDLKDRLSNFLFIGIPSEGNCRVLCLNHSNVMDQGTNAVILVHGFGIDIGRFTPSPKENSWRSAYDLFESDPDLSAYDFYMVNHWDDQDLVQSSFELACFLRMIKQAYGKGGDIILLGHSAGGLIVRHYTVSRFYEQGTVNRYLMLATPNYGSRAVLLHFEPERVKSRDMDGDGTAALEILPESRFLNCLNCKYQKPDEYASIFKIDRRLQDRQGLNPNIPCAILAGEVIEKMKGKFNKEGSAFCSVFEDLFGKRAGHWLKGLFQNMNSQLMDIMAKGDLLVSLKSQLIDGIPYEILPYAHGFLQTPHNRRDKRYLAMKNFILKGKLDMKGPLADPTSI